MFDKERGALTEAVRDLKTEIAELRVEREAVKSGRKFEDEARTLRESIEKLKIEKGRLSEEHEREVREVKHMVGLERRRQEFESEATKREATLTVREENLAADRTRFEEQMKFTQDRFEKEVGYLKGLMEQILLRLPTVTVDKTVETNGHGDKGRSRKVAAER